MLVNVQVFRCVIFSPKIDFQVLAGIHNVIFQIPIGHVFEVLVELKYLILKITIIYLFQI